MHFEVNTAARTEQPEQATCHDLATKRNAPAPGPGGNETGGRRQVGGTAGGAQGGNQDEHPHPGNTGVRDTSEGAKALIDWVGVTFKQLPLAEVLELFGGEREWLPTRGGMRYRSGLMRGNVRVYWDGLDEEEMGVHVEASGRGCRQLEAEGVVHHWSKFFEAALKDGAEFSRLDLAADDLAGDQQNTASLFGMQRDRPLLCFRSALLLQEPDRALDADRPTLPSHTVPLELDRARRPPIRADHASH